MTRRAFKQLVADVMKSLPANLLPYLNNVVVDVADKPAKKLLRKAGFSPAEIANGDTLLGLFDPLDIPSGWMSDGLALEDMPHRLWIFRQPHEEEFSDQNQLAIEIRKTVIHELAHHFGLSDRDLEKFDANPNPFRSSQK